MWTRYIRFEQGCRAYDAFAWMHSGQFARNKVGGTHKRNMGKEPLVVEGDIGLRKLGPDVGRKRRKSILIAKTLPKHCLRPPAKASQFAKRDRKRLVACACAIKRLAGIAEKPGTHFAYKGKRYMERAGSNVAPAHTSSQHGLRFGEGADDALWQLCSNEQSHSPYATILSP